MRVFLVNRELAANKAYTLQITFHYWSLADVEVPVVCHNSFSSRQGKTHITPICDSPVEGEISLVSHMVQAATMIHKPGIKKMLPVVTIVWLGTAYKEANHLQYGA